MSTDQTPPTDQTAQTEPTSMDEQRIISASRLVAADPETIFELIADPAQHPRWDGNDNVQEAQNPRRLQAAGEAFVMLNTNGKLRDNQVVEFEEGRRIAWMPGEVGKPRPGHIWRWEVSPQREGTLVTHTYDWTGLTDQKRLEKARGTKEANLQASVDRLAQLVEGQGDAQI